MKIARKEIQCSQRQGALKSWLDGEGRRLGLITSIDGGELITLVLDSKTPCAEVWSSPLESDQYPSLTPSFPMCHWFERAVWDLFGLYAAGHPRLKHLLLHEVYEPEFQPLRTIARPPEIVAHRKYDFLSVEGEGVYEIPVGPIHAGIIEPGHFRLSCLGESVLNLEIQLGFVHRGVEKRLTEVPWRKARFVAEAAASDTAVANALAHAIAVESILETDVPERAQFLRTLALEIERIAMHIIDIGGMAVDIGYLGVAASMGRLRGNALRLGDLLAGSRFMRGFIRPGGVGRDPDVKLVAIKEGAAALKKDLETVIGIFLESAQALERMEHIGRLSPSLARDFGMVGVVGRASGITYDTRQHFPQGVYPRLAPPPTVEKGGDIFARIKVRIGELFESIDVLQALTTQIPAGPVLSDLPDRLPADACGLGIVEAFRGELIHLFFTDGEGRIKRYTIKDPSFNNWTAVSIAVRNEVVADFPICNKSFSLSYSGHDL